MVAVDTATLLLVAEEVFDTAVGFRASVFAEGLGITFEAANSTLVDEAEEETSVPGRMESNPPAKNKANTIDATPITAVIN